jgi:hypothetical protein
MGYAIENAPDVQFSSTVWDGERVQQSNSSPN